MFVAHSLGDLQYAWNHTPIIGTTKITFVAKRMVVFDHYVGLKMDNLSETKNKQYFKS